jgi:hypothetical protein
VTATHPFAGGRKALPTERHSPVIWECMLGTVYARNPDGEVRYFDYRWDEARAFAFGDIDPADLDLRIAKAAQARNEWRICALPGDLRRNQVALWADWYRLVLS